MKLSSDTEFEEDSGKRCSVIDWMQQSSPDSHLSSNLVIALEEKRQCFAVSLLFFYESVSVNKLAKPILQHLSVLSDGFMCITE